MISADNAKAIAILTGLAVGGFLAYKVYSRGKKIITEDLNPVSDQNVVYLGLNRLTGGNNADSSIGTRIYDFFHPNE